MRELTSYLIADISKAGNFEEPDAGEAVLSIEQHFIEVENYLNGLSSDRTFGEYCGLESKYFPPAEYFSEEELKKICNQFEKMMFSWNLALDYPKKLPVSLIYNALVQILDTKTIIVRSEMIHFDYCSGYAPGCTWKEYCPCLEIWNRNG